MTALKTSLALASVLAWGGSAIGAAVAPEKLLTSYVPVFKGVDYDLPLAAVSAPDNVTKQLIEGCKVEATAKGFTLRDSQGRILRRFLDTNGKRTQRDGEKEAGTHLDQWSYYQDGFEVYRESDLDEDGSLDEVRWMNAGGTRIAKVHPVEVKGGGKSSQIGSWSRISAEEASKVLVQAVLDSDTNLLETVVASPEELTALGAPEATIKRATESAAKRDAGLVAIRKGLVGWTAKCNWWRFDGAMPHVIPADAAPGLKGDILMYENVTIFGAPPEGPSSELAMKMAFLGAPEVIKIGDCWKFVELPRPIDPGKPIASSLVSLRGDLMSGAIGDDRSKNPKLVEPLKELAAFDASGPPSAAAGKRDIAIWHLDRLKLLQKVIAAADDSTEKLTYNKQAVGNVAEAWKTGAYPEGATILDKFVAQGGPIAAFAAYRKILTQFDIDADAPGANFLTIQKECLAKFEKFLEQYPQSDEVPEVLYQLATVNEFNGEEKAAQDWYGKLAKEYPSTEPGKKAVGALYRLDLDGKTLKLAGMGVNGKPVSIDESRGKTALAVFFLAASEADQKELTELVALQKKLGGKLDVVGVSLDDDEATLKSYLKTASLPWPTIHEPGGMDSKPANDLGIISTPTMILVDAQGKVINRKLRHAAEVEKALEKPLAGKGIGLNLGAK